MKKEIEIILLGVLQKKTENEQKKFDDLFFNNLDWAWITGELIRHRLNGIFFQKLLTLCE